MNQPRIDPQRQYKGFRFSRHDTLECFQTTILNWLEATGNKLNGDIIAGLQGDDFIQDQIMVMVPFIESYLETGMYISISGELEYQLLQVISL